MFEKILEQLVFIDTSSGKSNLPLIRYVRKLLQDAGYITKTFGSKRYKNLFAFRKSSCPRIILATHSDTVVASKDWQSDPFKVLKKRGKLYGLGVSDVKGILAANLELSLEQYRANLALLISFNEETDFAGANLVGNKIIRSIDTVIVGEPTSNETILDAKGAVAYKISFLGKSAHGSQPEKGNSAIVALSNFVVDLEKKFKKTNFAGNSIKFENGNQTYNLGQVFGGDAINKVAEKASLTLEFRFTEASNLIRFDRLLDKLRKASKAKILIDQLIIIDPFSSSEKVRIKLTEIGASSALGVSYCCEANVYNKLTENCFIFGPGSINQAHEKDEFIKVNEIEEYQRKLKKIIRSF